MTRFYVGAGIWTHVLMLAQQAFSSNEPSSHVSWLQSLKTTISWSHLNCSPFHVQCWEFHLVAPKRYGEVVAALYKEPISGLAVAQGVFTEFLGTTCFHPNHSVGQEAQASACCTGTSWSRSAPYLPGWRPCVTTGDLVNWFWRPCLCYKVD